MSAGEADRTRRDLLRDGAALTAAGVAASYGLSGVDEADARRRRRRRRRRVAVLGGGVGGLTAAHELAERGFDVTVYEARAFGGKARSYGVPRSASGGRRPLPAEHGARFIPGLYANLPDTMRRIPFGRDPEGTWSNVVTARQASFARDRGREDLNWNFAPRDPRPWTVHQFRQSMVAALETSTRMPPHEIAWLVERLIVFFSSCDARRLRQWEGMSWYDFVSADRFSEDYRKLLVQSATQFVLGSKASEANARTLGLLWQAATYTVLGYGPNGEYDQVLSLPTNAAWINPWVKHLRTLGVRLHRGAQVTRLEMKRGRVVAAWVRRGSGSGSPERIEADWFVLAVPVERARRLLGKRFLRADPRLEGLRRLETRWMNGIQYFLRRPVPIVHGHVLYIDSPWALVSISQAQFWPRRDFPRHYGRGDVRECLSVDIAEFAKPGIAYRRPARDLSRRQIARDTWEQMKAHLNDRGHEVLRDSDVVRWYLDPGLVYRPGHRGPLVNRDPLFISTPGSWHDRPGARTAVPNLFLAADYVRVGVDTASMEGACDAGRQAANGVLDAADSPETAVPVRGLYQPPEWEPLRRADAALWARGERNAFDVPLPPGLGRR